MRVIVLSEKKIKKGIETLEKLTHTAIMNDDFGLFEDGVELMNDVFGMRGLLYGKEKSDERCAQIGIDLFMRGANNEDRQETT